MATIKSYTDLEQSKKLAEILPLESADMRYQVHYDNKNNIKYIPRFISTIIPLRCDIPCWSLSALLGVMPEIQGVKPVIALDDNYITYPHMSDLYTKADNLVDACVAMIEKLHELKML